MAAEQRTMVCLDDFEEYARLALPKASYDYISGGAGDEVTCLSNRQSFTRYKLLPSVLRDVSNVSLRTSILGQRIDIPIGIAPMSIHKLAHPAGELATVSAAASVNTVYTMSTYSSSTMEEVSEKAPNCARFLQLYIPSDKGRPFLVDMVKRAERNHFSALVLTVDTPVLGIRYKNARNRFDIPPYITFENAKLSCSNVGVQLNFNHFTEFMLNPSLSWQDVKWLTSLTSLPVIVKGILTSKDAELAVEYGASAVWISNHGGRQLDTVPATIDVLQSVSSAVRGRCEVYVDGGIRRGTDVLKCLALGADVVFIGRPVLYGLAYNGENGVKDVLRILSSELSSAMALSGCRNLSEIKRELIADGYSLAKL